MENKDCEICMENFDIIHSRCSRCLKNHCINCYIEIFRANNGLIICPFCRNSFGLISDDKLIIEVSILEIKQKAGLLTLEDCRKLKSEIKNLLIGKRKASLNRELMNIADNSNFIL